MAVQQVNPQELQKKHDRWNMALLSLMVAFIIIISWVAYLSIIDPPKNSETFTEFYIKDASSLLKSNKLTVDVDQLISLHVVIANQEGIQSAYQTRIEYDDQVYTSTVYVVDNNQSIEIPIQFSMPTIGKNQVVNIFLGRERSSFPYRELHLLVDVQETKVYLPIIRR